jgi:hypothetical protein
MATKGELFASRFFKAENFKKPTVLEIQHCAVEALKNQEGVSKEKLVVFFVGQKQQLVCNATNFDAIVDVTGEDDTDRWIGHKICLYPTMTQLGNKRVPCIRIKAPPVAGKAAAPAAQHDELNPPESELNDSLEADFGIEA